MVDNNSNDGNAMLYGGVAGVFWWNAGGNGGRGFAIMTDLIARFTISHSAAHKHIHVYRKWFASHSLNVICFGAQASFH